MNIYKSIKKRLFKGNASIQTQLFKRLMLIFLLIFSINMAFYYKNTSSMYSRELENFNGSLVEQVALSHRQIIRYAQETIYQMIYNDTTLEKLLVNYDKSYSSNTELMNRLYSIINSNSYFSSVYLFIPKTQTVLSTEFSIFYDIHEFYDVYPIENQDKTQIKVFEMRQFQLRNESMNYITITCNIPLTQASTAGIIVVNINIDKVYKDILDKMNLKGSSNLIVMDNQKNILLTKSFGFIEGRNGALTLDELNEIKSTKLQHTIKNNSIISKYFLSKESLIFYSILFMAQSKQNTGLSLVIFAVSILLLGSILLYISSSATLGPLKNIMGRVTNDKNYGNNVNDLERLDHFVSSMQNENLNLNERYKEMLPIYKEKLFYNILTNNLYSSDEIHAKLDYYQLDLGLRHYIALTMLIDIRTDYENKSSFLKTHIISIIERIINEKNKGFCIEVENNKFGIALNLKDENFSDELYNDILKMANEIVETVRFEIGQSCILGVGSFADDIENLHVSYHESVDALSYSKTFNIPVVYSYQIKSFSGQTFSYPYEFEKQLLSAIKTADYDSSTKLLRNIFDQLKAQKALKDNELECIILQLLSSLNTLVFELKLNFDKYRELQHLLPSIKDSKLLEIEVLITKHVQDILQERNRQINNSKSKIKQIIDYTNLHYCENIQLIDLEEQFKLSRYYISQLLKEHTGENFNEYINYKRIEKAKELLKNTDLSIKEIAEKVGFNYSYYFGKVFKQQESVTPGEYRNNL